MDRITPAQRSANMRAVRRTDTAPEMQVRRLLHGLGYRFRLHRRDLPGTPDIVFGPRKKAIFVHGCFWHGHDCKRGRLPASRQEYWGPKIERNRRRDQAALDRLAEIGWIPMVLWECQLNEGLADRLQSYLDPSHQA